MKRPGIFIQTNAKQAIGAIVSAYSMKRNSARADDFDVTIMRIAENHIQMIGSSGDHKLGGKDWDDVIVNWVSEEFDRQFGGRAFQDRLELVRSAE